jgi:hypothetical protein
MGTRVAWAVLVLAAMAFLGAAGCRGGKSKKEAAMERLDRLRGHQPGTMARALETLDAPEVTPESAEPSEKEPVTFADHAARLKDKLGACQKRMLTKFDYNQLNDGLPPVMVNEFDDLCKPVIDLYGAIDEKWGGKTLEADAWLADVALLADDVFQLSGMLKNLGTRSLSALLERMKAAEKEALEVAGRVQAAAVPDEKAWRAYAEGARAQHGTPEAAFGALKADAEALLAFFEPRVLEPIKKDHMFWFNSFGHKARALRALFDALPHAARADEVRAVVATWGLVEKLLETNFQDRKDELVSLAAELKKRTSALAKPKK